jgi:hypothetical protein
MADAHTDADVVKVTRTTTTYEPAAKKSGPTPARRRSSTLLWAIGIGAVVVVAVGAIAYENQNTPASAQQNPVAADQSHAQTLSQQAATAQQTAQSAQQSADQSEAQARSLAAAAAQDRAAARRAAVKDSLVKTN